MKGVKLVLTAADVAISARPCQAPIPNADGTQMVAAALSGAGEGRAPCRRRGRLRGGRDRVPGPRRGRGDRDRIRGAAGRRGIEAAAKPGAPPSGRSARATSPSIPRWATKAKVDADLRQGRPGHVRSLDRQQPSGHQLHGDARRRRRIRRQARERYTLTSRQPGRARHPRHAGRRHPQGAPEGESASSRPAMSAAASAPRPSCYREYPLAAEAAKRLKRPVRWIADRSRPFHRRRAGPRQLHRGRGGDGQDAAASSAMRFDILGDIGAYLLAVRRPTSRLSAAHDDRRATTRRRLHVRVRGFYTNTVPVDAYRGAGRPEAAYLLERLVDRTAREMGMKPDAIRAPNFIPPRQMPYTTADRRPDLRHAATSTSTSTRAMEAADWAGFKDRAAAPPARTARSAASASRPISSARAWGAGEDVDVRLETDGTVDRLFGTQSNGQGHATAYAQFASQHLDLPLDQIRVRPGRH